MSTSANPQQMQKLQKTKKHIAQVRQKIKTDKVKAIRLMNDLAEKLETHSS